MTNTDKLTNDNEMKMPSNNSIATTTMLVTDAARRNERGKGTIMKKN